MSGFFYPLICNFLKFYLFLKLFLAVLYLHCCTGFSLVSVCRLLIVVASHCGAQARGILGCSSWGSQAPKRRLSSYGPWD